MTGFVLQGHIYFKKKIVCKGIYNVKMFLFQINAVLLKCIFIEESWKIKKY